MSSTHMKPDVDRQIYWTIVSMRGRPPCVCRLAKGRSKIVGPRISDVGQKHDAPGARVCVVYSSRHQGLIDALRPQTDDPAETCQAALRGASGARSEHSSETIPFEDVLRWTRVHSCRLSTTTN